jgi:hypothetical protein
MSEPFLKIYDSFQEVYQKDYLGSKTAQNVFIIDISEYIEEKTGRLVYEGRNMNCRDMANILGKKKDKVARIVTDMITNGTMLGFDGAFFINPQYIQADHMTDGEYAKLREEGE